YLDLLYFSTRRSSDLVGLAGVDLQRQTVAATEDIVLADTGRQDHLVGRAIAHTQVDHAGGLFLDVDVDVDLIRRARHGLGLDVVDRKSTRLNSSHVKI